MKKKFTGKFVAVRFCLLVTLLCSVPGACEGAGQRGVALSDRAKSSACRSGDEQRKRVVDRALGFMDTRYLYGGNRLETGFDCSGFVRFVFHESGIELPRMARVQSKVGRPVDRKKLRKGDLVFFHVRGRRIDHVGLFIGDDAFVHASKSGSKVKVSSLKNPFWVQRFACARQVLPD